MIRKTHANTDLLEALMSENHLSDAMLAEKLKMNRTTIFRARGGSPVGEQFIAGLLTVFPGKRFEDFFLCAKCCVDVTLQNYVRCNVHDN